MTRQVIQREKLGALTKIGQGGQGVVYRAPNVKTKFAASMVYKEYKAQTLAQIDFTALGAMPALVEESLSYAEAERLISIAAWPCALVEDAGSSTGFVMPAIGEEFFIPLTTVKGVSTITAEFQHLLNHSSVLAARGIDIDDAQRYSLLREVASALAFLHKHGVCVGDISPKNLLFSLTPHEAMYFIDCDAMRINAVSALPQMETPGMGGAGRRGTGHHLFRYLQTRPAGPAAAGRRPRHYKSPAHPFDDTGLAAPDHHRHPHQTTTTAPTARSLDLRPRPCHRTRPTSTKHRNSSCSSGQHRTRCSSHTRRTLQTLSVYDTLQTTTPTAAATTSVGGPTTNLIEDSSVDWRRRCGERGYLRVNYVHRGTRGQEQFLTIIGNLVHYRSFGLPV